MDSRKLILATPVALKVGPQRQEVYGAPIETSDEARYAAIFAEHWATAAQ